MKMKEYKNGRGRVTTLMTNETIRKLAMLAANSGITRPDMLENLISEKWDKVFGNEFISLEDVAD